MNQEFSKRICAITLASIMTISTAGCSNSKFDDSELPEQTSVSALATYLDERHSEIYSVVQLSNGDRRGILLSDEPHLYKSMFEETATKVYLSDENGKRLSNNFDVISSLSNYSYLTTGGILLGTLSKVEVVGHYDYFVGQNLRKDSNNNTLGPTITLLDKDGVELYSFNGYFNALVGNVLVIEDYFEGEDRVVGAPDTYLYDYVTGKKSENHHYVKIFECEDEKSGVMPYLIGVNLYHNNSYAAECLYSFYDANLDIIATATEEEIEDWYISNDDWDSFRTAGGDYGAYFKSVYQNDDSVKQLEKDRENS